jgi:hypothetical protein
MLETTFPATAPATLSNTPPPILPSAPIERLRRVVFRAFLRLAIFFDFDY